MTCACVSFASTPRSASRSQNARAGPAAAAISTPTSRPRPRISAMHGARSARSLFEQILALRGRALGEPLVDEHAQRRASDGRGERVAAERAAVVAGAKQRHDRAAREHGRHGIDAAAERLAEHEHVGVGARLVVVREHLARAPQPGLNLVEHEQHVSRAAKRARGGEIAQSAARRCRPRPGSARRGTRPCSA